MNFYQLIISLLCFSLGSCVTTQRGWTSMRWAEKPQYSEPIQQVPEEKRLHFEKMASYQVGDGNFSSIKKQLREGDVIAYSMTRAEARKEVATGNFNSIGYALLDYGHLAILTSVKGQQGLRLFSSQSMKGPNTDEGVATLQDHSFDVYRLNRWDQVDHPRFHEFVGKSKKKAGNWIGYDFSGMFGLWNSNLRPEMADEIGHDYICSTVVVASLYYAGADMQVSGRKGYVDLVSPRQVVTSHGYLRNR